MERLPMGIFQEQQELIRNFAWWRTCGFENAKNQKITGKERLLGEKITFFRRSRRL